MKFNFAKQQDNKKSAVSLIIGAVVLVLVVVMMFIGKVSAEFKDTELKIKVTPTMYKSTTIAYENIASVTYEEIIDSGTRVFGYGGGKLSLGLFKNEQLGSYTKYGYSKNKKYVIIKTDSLIVAVNFEDEEATHAFYKELLQKIS